MMGHDRGNLMGLIQVLVVEQPVGQGRNNTSAEDTDTDPLRKVPSLRSRAPCLGPSRTFTVLERASLPMCAQCAVAYRLGTYVLHAAFAGSWSLLATLGYMYPA